MKYQILGNRIPHEYFITSGKGESDCFSKGLPFETGSYDAALTKAGIENTNIIPYTSIMPTEAIKISKKEGIKRLKWGEVLEVIKAENNGSKGDFISAAVMTTDVYDPKGKYLGGIACEYAGEEDENYAKINLCKSIKDIISRRGFGNIKDEPKINEKNITNKGYTFIPGVNFIYDSLKIKKNKGTVLAAICFVSYKFPLLHLQ